MAQPKPIVASRLATRDIEDALRYYAAEAGHDVARRFSNALRAARERIGSHPGIGSPRYAHALSLPGLRAWSVAGFPHLLLYVEKKDAIYLARMMHGSRDIAAWLTALEDD